MQVTTDGNQIKFKDLLSLPLSLEDEEGEGLVVCKQHCNKLHSFIPININSIITQIWILSHMLQSPLLVIITTEQECNVK